MSVIRPVCDSVAPVSSQLRETKHRSSDLTLHRWVVYTWIGFALTVSVKALVSPDQHTTYPAFEYGSVCWWSDVNMYDVETQEHDYRYSPTFAVLFSVFAWWSRPIGGAVWGLTSTLFTLYAICRVLRFGYRIHWTPRQEALFLAIAGLAMVRGIWSAQTNTVIFGCVALACVALEQRRYWWSALWLALPVYIKIWPVAAALLLIACRPRALTVRFTLVMLGLACVPFLTRTPATVITQYGNWFEALLGPMQQRHVYRDAWTVWELFQSPVPRGAYAAVQLTSAFATLGLCLWQRWRDPRLARNSMFVLGLWCCWQLVFGPGTERNTLCLVAVPLAWNLVGALMPGRPRFDGVLAISACVLLIAASFGEIERSLLKLSPAALVMAPLGTLLLGAGLLRHEHQQQPRMTESATDAPQRTNGLSKAA